MSSVEPILAVVKITDQNRQTIFEMAMRVYLGEKCAYCGRTFATLDDVQEAVWYGAHANGRRACEACWDAAHVEGQSEDD